MGRVISMSESLGRILQKLRREQGLSQKELCRGLCSIPTLSRIESGEREPDQMLFDSLISRLGKDSTKWELILKESDKKLLQKRSYIEYLIQAEEWEELKEKLEDYKEFGGLVKNLQEQYICLVQAILYKQERKYEDALQSCYEGLEKTKLQIDDKQFRIRERVSRNELRLLCCIGEVLYFKEESEEKGYKYWKELLEYIERFCTDEQYQLRFYIQGQYYLARIEFEQQRFTDSIFHWNNGIRKIQEKRTIYYLDCFLMLLKDLKSVDNKMIEYISEEDIEILLKTLSEWKEENKRLNNKEKYIRPKNNIYSINEVIKNTRYMLGKKQEEMIEGEKGRGISSQSSISEIENGKRNTRKETYEYYVEKLGLQEKGDSFQLSIEGEDFEIQELRWEIDFCIFVHDIGKAKQLLEQLKEKIDLSQVCNEQYIRKIELFIKNEKGKMDCEQWRKEIIDILSLTIPDINKIEEMAFFSREEVFLIMNFGCMYHENQKYDKALKYYERLEKYFDTYYPTSSLNIYKTILYNLSQVYGLLGQYKKSVEKSKLCIFLDILDERAVLWYEAIYNIAWCYGKKMLEENKIIKKFQYQQHCKKLFQQSYALAKFYKDKVLVEAIQEKIRIWNI